MKPGHRTTSGIRFLSISVLLSVLASPFQAQDKSQNKSDDTPIKIQSTLISVPAVVSDREDRYIAGLKAGDFKLYEDGIEQDIAFFEATEQPINIALLIDTSRSTARILDEIKDSAMDFLRELRSQDRAMVVAFDYDVHVLSPLTNNRKSLERAIREAEIGEMVGTVLRDAVIEATHRHLKNVDGRKAVILLTDGKDHQSGISEKDLLEEATESGAMIYTIYYETMGAGFQRGRRHQFPPEGGARRRERRFPRRDIDPARDERRERRAQRNETAVGFLTELAEVSAGRFYTSNADDLRDTFGAIADELRHQYYLGFYPDSEKLDGKPHSIKVTVSRSGAVVRARRSYTAARTDQTGN